MALTADGLVELLARGGADVTWLRQTLAGAAIGAELGVRTAYARAGRMFGDAPLGDDAPLELRHWSRADAARAALLLTALAIRPAAEHVALAERLLHGGELGEQVSLLRSLAQLPEPARFVALARDATRTNVVPVFEALACDNPFVAHLPAEALRQLVLKAIFLGVPAGRIVGLPARVDAELVRMLADYAAERRAAGRAVPDDVALVTQMMETRP